MVSQVTHDIESLFNHQELDGAFEFRPNGWDMYNWQTIPAHLGSVDKDLFPYDNFFLLFSNDYFEEYLQDYLFSTNYYY